MLLDATEQSVMALTIVLRVGQLGAATLFVGTCAWRLLVVRPTLLPPEKTWRSADGTSFDSGLCRLRVGSLLGLWGCGVLGLWVHLVTVTNQALFHPVSLEQLAKVLLRTQYGRVWLIRLGLTGLLGGCVWYGERERRDRAPWGLRLTCAGLAGGILVAQAWSGHATTAEEIPMVWQALVCVKSCAKSMASATSADCAWSWVSCWVSASVRFASHRSTSQIARRGSRLAACLRPAGDGSRCRGAKKSVENLSTP